MSNICIVEAGPSSVNILAGTPPKDFFMPPQPKPEYVLFKDNTDLLSTHDKSIAVMVAKILDPDIKVDWEISIGTYRTSNGQVAHILFEDPRPGAIYRFYGYLENDEPDQDLRSWTKKGVTITGMTSPSDLVYRISKG